MEGKRRVARGKLASRYATTLVLALALVEEANRLVSLATKLLSALDQLRKHVERFANLLPAPTLTGNIEFATALHLVMGAACAYFALRFEYDPKQRRAWLLMIGAAVLYYLALCASVLCGYPLVGHNQAVEVINLLLTLCIWNFADTLAPTRNTKRARWSRYALAGMAILLGLALSLSGESNVPYLAAFGVTPMLFAATLRLWLACGNVPNPSRQMAFWRIGVLIWACSIPIIRPALIFHPELAATGVALFYYSCMGGKFCVAAFVGPTTPSVAAKRKKRSPKAGRRSNTDSTRKNFVALPTA